LSGRSSGSKIFSWQRQITTQRHQAEDKIRSWEVLKMNAPAESAFVEFIRYNNWANAQIIAACQKLTAEQLAATAPGAYGTIRDTLEHIVRAEASYLGRMTGERPQPPFQWQDQPALADISSYAGQVAGALLEAVQRIPPTSIVHEEENGLFIDYQARLLFLQIVNHGIEHRTNITTILSGHGLEAPTVDGWGYLFSHPDRFELQEGSL
jgi:uncharacterized damage-inducible protein DinB